MKQVSELLNNITLLLSSFKKEFNSKLTDLLVRDFNETVFLKDKIALWRIIEKTKIGINKNLAEAITVKWQESSTSVYKYLRSSKINATLSVLDYQIYDNLVKETLTKYNKSFSTLNNSFDEFLRRSRAGGFFQEEVRNSIKRMLNGESYDAAKISPIKTLLESSTNGRIVINGKYYGVDFYTDLVTTTALSAAQNRATESLLLDNNITKVIISAHGSNDWCSFFENKIFSLVEGNTEGIPYIGNLPSGGCPFHPFCRHLELPFISSTIPNTAIIDKELLSNNSNFLRKAYKNSKRQS